MFVISLRKITPSYLQSVECHEYPDKSIDLLQKGIQNSDVNTTVGGPNKGQRKNSLTVGSLYEVLVKVETDFLQVLLNHFSEFPGGENCFWIFDKFLKNRQKSKKNFPIWKLREVIQQYLKKFCFNFYQNQKISFVDSIFTVQALNITQGC